jgi:hypothetical protein
VWACGKSSLWGLFSDRIRIRGLTQHHSIYKQSPFQILAGRASILANILRAPLQMTPLKTEQTFLTRHHRSYLRRRYPTAVVTPLLPSQGATAPIAHPKLRRRYSPLVSGIAPLTQATYPADPGFCPDGACARSTSISYPFTEKVNLACTSPTRVVYTLIPVKFHDSALLPPLKTSAPRSTKGCGWSITRIFSTLASTFSPIFRVVTPSTTPA